MLLPSRGGIVQDQVASCLSLCLHPTYHTPQHPGNIIQHPRTVHADRVETLGANILKKLLLDMVGSSYVINHTEPNERHDNNKEYQY